MRRWVKVWVGVVVALLVLWGGLAVLADVLTAQDDRPAHAELRLDVSQPPGEGRVTAVASAAPGRAVRPAPRAPRAAGGTPVVPDGWSVVGATGLSLAVPPGWSADDSPWPAVDRGTPDAGWRSPADLVGPGELPAQVAVAALPASWDDATGGWSERRDLTVPGARQATLETAERSTGSGGTVLHARVVVRVALDGPAQVVDLRLPPASSGGLDLLDAFVGSLSVGG